MAINTIQEAAFLIASYFQTKSLEKGKGPVEALASIDILLPDEIPNDWRACDFQSLIILNQEGDNE